MITGDDAYSFFVNGFVHGHVDGLELVDVDQYQFVDCIDGRQRDFDVSLQPILDSAYTYLVENYVGKIFPSYTLNDMYVWKGVDAPSSEWHNDWNGKFNSNIIVYMDDSYDMNCIQIKNSAEEFIVYPKKGDFVWINQNPKFKHRATHVWGERRVMSFEFNIDNLWT